MPVDEVIRPATRSDIPALCVLFEEVFAQSRAPEVWAWKYFDNPRGTYSHVVEAGGRLVAHCGGTPIVMRDGSRRYTALQSVDFMSSRRYAGGIGRGGVFARMVDSFFELHCRVGSIEMVYGFPGERHRVLGEKILRYAAVEPVGELILEGVDRTTRATPLNLNNLALLSQASVRFGGVRDEAYLRWRYSDHPAFRYEMVEVHRWPWRRPVAAAVVRDSGSELLMMELMGDLGERDALRMVSELTGLGRRVSAWGSLLHPRSRRLVEAGFSGRERPHRLEVRFFNQRGVPSAGELYYSLGDYDVY